MATNIVWPIIYSDGSGGLRVLILCVSSGYVPTPSEKGLRRIDAR